MISRPVMTGSCRAGCAGRLRWPAQPALLDRDRRAGAARFERRLHRGEDRTTRAHAENRVATFIKRTREVVGEQEIVLARDAALPRFLRRLVLVVDADFRP